MFIAYLSIPPFVVTLATMLMGRGLTYTLLQAQTKGPLPDDFVFIGAGFLPTMKVGGIDLVSIIVAVICTIAVILAELNSIKTKKKYGFVLNPTWQVVLKNAFLLFIIWFFFYKHFLLQERYQLKLKELPC